MIASYIKGHAHLWYHKMKLYRNVLKIIAGMHFQSHKVDIVLYIVKDSNTVGFATFKGLKMC